MRILIVEDDPISSRLLQVILSVYGNLSTVENGEAAVYAFVRAWRKRKPYDLICMDIMMPKMNGIDALKHIRRIEESNGIPRNQRVKVIMLTALDDTASVTEAFFEGGATAYLVKPLDRAKLLKEFENLGLLQAQNRSAPSSANDQKYPLKINPE